MKKLLIGFSFIPGLILLVSTQAISNDGALRQKLHQLVQAHTGAEIFSIRHHNDFSYQITLMEIYDQLSPELQKEADVELKVTAPIRQVTLQSPSTRFTMHYDTTGLHAVPADDISGNGVPDYIDSTGVILDHVWQVTIDELGFLAPLDTTGHTVSTYHIYFTSMSEYGSTQPLGEISDNRPNNYASYILINNNMQQVNTKGLDGLRVTCAHEFNHAIQLCYSYRSFSERFIFEMTSTWMEDIIYPDINDYFYYLDNFFYGAQQIRFTSMDGFDPYANCLYMHMISKTYSNEIVVEIWQQMVQEKAMDALETVLNRHYTTFSQSLNNYARWLYFTGDRTIPGEFFTDAVYFPMINIPSSAQFKINFIVKHHFQVYPQSFYYLKIDSITTFAGNMDAIAEINDQLIQVNYFNSEKYYTNPSQAGENLPVLLESIPQDLVFVVSNSTDNFTTVDFTFVTDSSIMPREEGSPVAYGPNPTNIGQGVKSANFWAVPAFARIIIMDLNQHPVRELYNDEFFDTPVTWDLKDKNGNLVSSGIYFYIVATQNKTQINKIAIIR